MNPGILNNQKKLRLRLYYSIIHTSGLEKREMRILLEQVELNDGSQTIEIR